MKKIIIIIAALTLIITASACRQPWPPEEISETVSPDPAKETVYTGAYVDWVYYDTAEEVIAQNAVVIAAKVTGMTFVVMTPAPRAPADMSSNLSDCEMYRVYDIEIIETYKGGASNINRVMMWGGYRDEYLAEQQAALSETPAAEVTIVQPTQYPEIGKTYVLTFNIPQTGYPTVSGGQGVFEVYKTAFDGTDDSFDAKNYVNYFGEGKWDELIELVYGG